jgi:hypothetical protein
MSAAALCAWPLACDLPPECGRSLCRTHRRQKKVLAEWLGAPVGTGRFRPKPDDEVRYSTCHARKERADGPARDHPCIDCGQPADQWSMEPHRASHVRRELRPDRSGERRWTLYSADRTAYVPRCRRCHNLYDRSEDRERWWLLDFDHRPVAHLSGLSWDESLRHLVEEDEGWTPEVEEVWRSFR